MATPQGWQPGDKLIVHNSLKTEDAKKHFEGKEVEEVFVRLTLSLSGRVEVVEEEPDADKEEEVGVVNEAVEGPCAPDWPLSSALCVSHLFLSVH